ncbi:MAG: hypothetical protein K8L99_07885, partial [Anaerolineae bacterium]|nr:hypothetical protein [Anaerolineae bacterium]
HYIVNWYPRDTLRMPVLSIQALINPLQPVDLNELVPKPQFSLGLPLLIFIPVGLVTSLFARRASGFLWLFGGLGLLTAIAGVTLFQEQTWLVAVITLCAAIMASGTMYLRSFLQPAASRLFLPVLLVSILALAQQAGLVPRWPETFGETGALQQILYEQQGSGIAVLPPDAPIPSTISPDITPNRFLISGYQSSSVNKIAPNSISTGAQLNVINHSTHSDRFQVQLNNPTRLNILTAFFPGWQANALDRILAPGRDPASGLMYVDVPAMNGELRLTFGTTPDRESAWIISAAALICGGLLTWWRRRTPKPLSLDFQLLTVAESRLVAVCAVSFGGILLLFATPSSPFTLHTQPGHGLDQAFSIRSRTQNGLEAIAYRVNTQRLRPGEKLDLTLYWQTIRPLPGNYRTQVYLQNVDQGTRWHRTLFYTPGDYPTSRWRRYMYVTDEYQIPLSQTIVPGLYEIVVEVYDCRDVCDNTDRLIFFDSDGNQLGPSLVLPGNIRIGG